VALAEGGLVRSVRSQRRVALGVAIALSLAAHALLVLLVAWALPALRPEASAPILWVRVMSEPTPLTTQVRQPLPAPRPVAPERLPVAEAAPLASAPPAAGAEPAPGAAIAERSADSPAQALRLRSRRTPLYPQAARLRGAEGVTLLRVRVEGSGRVGEVRIEHSAGDGALDRAASQAIRAWRFEPLRELRSLWVLIPVEFHLR
jgi:periplasmic protein TonB